MLDQSDGRLPAHLHSQPMKIVWSVNTLHMRSVATGLPVVLDVYQTILTWPSCAAGLRPVRPVVSTCVQGVKGYFVTLKAVIPTIKELHASHARPA